MVLFFFFNCNYKESYIESSLSLQMETRLRTHTELGYLTWRTAHFAFLLEVQVVGRGIKGVFLKILTENGWCCGQYTS